MEDLDEIHIGPFAHQFINIGTSLSNEEEEYEQVDKLIKNVDLFTQAPSDMSGIDTKMVSHCLTIQLASRLVAQMKQKVSEEKRVVIDEEVRKLSDTVFITKTKHPTWLANMIMLWKTINRWSMFVDFTDMNASYPKDPHLLPNIDRLIDGSSGYRILSFMNTYSGYNQI